MSNIQHIAFIMDGNRRWSRSNNMDLYDAYYNGASKAREIIEFLILERKIPFVSLYGLSIENFKYRSKEEINTIESVLDIFIKTIKDVFDNYTTKFSIKIIGNYQQLSSQLVDSINNIMDYTRAYNEYNVYLYLNYGGRDEIVRAVNKFITKSSAPITEQDITDNLYICDAPDPNLIVRTAGAQRLSGFLTWQSIYSELYFIEKLWSDLVLDDINHILDNYNMININYGK